VQDTVVIYAASVFSFALTFRSQDYVMKQSIKVVFLLLVATAIAQAQGKGVDKQSERVRDSGSSTAPASNGTKQDTGVGRGMDFGRGRTPAVPMIPNPYRFTARRDVIVKAVADVMRDRKLIMDEAASKPGEGLVVSQPYTFIKGAVVAKSQIGRLANLPDLSSRDWTKGRYKITVVVQPIDGTSSNVTVTATIEGLTEGARGGEWLTLESNGTAEQEFLSALIESITGVTPPGHESKP
jgi:hypothetical protein